MTENLAGAEKADISKTRARRLRSRRWRDPRLLLGILLVTSSIVIGSVLFAQQDDTTNYWVLASDVNVGEHVTRSAFRSADVQLGTAAQHQYLKVSDEFPASLDQLEWARDASRGELVSPSILVSSDRAGAELPLSVAAGAYPEDLRAGQRVDVWVTPTSKQSEKQGASRLLEGVTVVSAGGDAGAIAGAVATTVLVAVEPGSVRPDIVAALAQGRVTLVRLP